VDHNRLFIELDLNAALEGHARGLDEEIEKAPEDHLLQVDDDEWVAALVARYTIVTPELRPDDWWMDQTETQVDVSWDQNRAILDPSQPAYVPGHRVEVHIPFSGEKDVFKYRPSSWTTVLPIAEVRDGELVQTIEYSADSPRNVRAEADGLVTQINRYLEWARGDIERFNDSLGARTPTAIRRRRDRVRQNYERLAETGIPMRRPDQAPQTYIADVIVRRPSPTIPQGLTGDSARAGPVGCDFRARPRDDPRCRRGHGAQPKDLRWHG
jgi:hypothetical protein